MINGIENAVKYKNKHILYWVFFSFFGTDWKKTNSALHIILLIYIFIQLLHTYQSSLYFFKRLDDLKKNMNATGESLKATVCKINCEI